MIQQTKGMDVLTGLVLLSFTVGLTRADDWPQWRGPERNGVSRETGLLPSWPENGPKLVWQIQDAGRGYSTPAAVGERLYLLGNDGLENEFVQARSVQDGRRLWSTRLGQVGNPKQEPNFPAARSTPTIDGEWLYALGSDGDLACLAVATGVVRWRKNLRSEFDGKPGAWAYAESPLLDGDALICTPGGNSATVVALNKQSGTTLWKAGLQEGDEAAYSSAIVVEAGGVRQYVQMLGKGLVGLEAGTGKFLWRYTNTVSRFGANIPTPLAADNGIYTAGAGTGGGLIKLVAQDAGVQPVQVYFGSKLPTSIGGAVKIGDYLYGTTAQALLCLDFNTGKIHWEERALGAASLCYAGERLYLHGENGDVALVEPSPEAYRERGRFTPPGQAAKANPMEKAWAFPVVANGRLYLRDHQVVWCYDVRAR